MFLDAEQAFHELSSVRGIELLWDEGAARVTITVRLGRPAAPREAVAAAISAANSQLGLVGFRFDGEEVVFSLSAFLDPDGRLSSLVLQRMIAAGREAVRSFTA
jgi:hypothetical protein